MGVIGIDLGTTYCAASHFLDGESEVIYLEGQPTMPSVVSVVRSGQVVVGWTAKRNQSKCPQDTVVEVKRKMGDKVKIPLGQKELSPQEISAMILKKIKEEAEKIVGEITGAVITCPAYFKEPKRKATEEAGQIAGINVLRVVNEPTAAAYAYGVAQKDEGKKNLYLVYDLGGGTFDVTVISMIGGSLKVIGTGGDPNLGGGDFDDCIVDWMMEYIEKIPGYADTLTEEKRNALKIRLKSYAEEGKEKLCGPPAREEYQFQIPSIGKFESRKIPFNETLTMEKFNDLISDLVEKSLECIKTAMSVPEKKHHYTEKDITEILLVGGSTRVPLVQDKLKKRFPNTPIRGVESGINPDEIVAIGAGIMAAENDPDSDEVPENILIDVTGHTLSVEVYNEEQNKLELSQIIEKETPIPTSATHQFSSLGDFTTAARIKVYQGEGKEIDPEKVTMIGEFEIPLDSVRERIPLAIGLDLDENGILIAHATNLLNGQSVKCELNYDDSAKMSPEELEKRKKNLEIQIQKGVGATANPLDEKLPAVQPGIAGLPQAGTTFRPSFQAQQPAANTVVDARTMMNPIIRDLYDRAINNFTKIPVDRQEQVMNLVTEIENVAKTGNQAQLLSFIKPLSQLLEGVN
ncbi:MAG: Hsp70 family protein [Candidatus Aminicenantes bacterium]|jgi:molecular chaperone DnaK